VHPFLALGREFRQRGHDVLVFTSANFEPDIRSAGLSAVAVGSVEQYDAIVRHRDAFHPRRGFRVIAEAALAWTPEVYRQLDAHVIPGRTVVVGSTLAFAARLLAERTGVPGVTVHLSPSIIRSAIRPPVLGDPPWPSWTPPPAIRGLWYAVDRWFIDPIVCPPLNRLRADLGLTPVARVFEDWIHGGALVVGMFPTWFAAPQPDWPRAVRLTGFALYDDPSVRLSPEIRAFLDDGPPPVIFTTGTAVALERRFFEESVEACRLAGRRGLLISRYAEQVPGRLPEGVWHARSVPFSEVFSRSAAVVHHGGVGTLAQALRAGVPQIVRPLAFDQFDNAARLRGLGVAKVIGVNRYRAAVVAQALDEITSSIETAEATSTARIRLRDAGAVRQTADLILTAAGG